MKPIYALSSLNRDLNQQTVPCLSSKWNPWLKNLEYATPEINAQLIGALFIRNTIEQPGTLRGVRVAYVNGDSRKMQHEDRKLD
jgi:hypothetical protein